MKEDFNPSTRHLGVIMVTPTELTAGISTLATIAIGYTMAIRVLSIAIPRRNRALMIAGVLFFAMVSPWISFSLSHF